MVSRDVEVDLSEVCASRLYDVKPTDGMVSGSVAFLLVAVALLCRRKEPSGLIRQSRSDMSELEPRLNSTAGLMSVINDQERPLGGQRCGVSPRLIR